MRHRNLILTVLVTTSVVGCQTTQMQGPTAELAQRVTAENCVVARESGTQRRTPSPSDVYVFSVTDRHAGWMAADISFAGVRDNVYFHNTIDAVACGTASWRNLQSDHPEYFMANYDPELKRSIAVKWEGYTDLFSGVIVEKPNQKGGDISVLLPNNEGKCTGGYEMKDRARGIWNVTCTNGLEASGEFIAFGKGQGSKGHGVDAQGRSVTYTIGGKL